MASLTGDDGSEDVNDFLARIRELGDKRDREDDERTRKLEEEIMKGRQERAARRAERARSISPTKDSPASALSSVPASHPALGTPTPLKPEMPPPQESAADSSPLAQEPSKPAPPPQSSLSRSSTLSWQQRPGSRGSTPTVRSRPLSMVAVENSSMRSPSATPEPSSVQEKEKLGPVQSSTTTVPSRASSPNTQTSANHPAASMLANKEPSFFRQTPDRGTGSAAYRKSEDSTSSDTLSRGGSVRLHGLAQQPTELEKSPGPVGSLRGRPQSMASPLPLSDARRTESMSTADYGLDRTTTMSPSQGRASPERTDRPSSPTKGLGGFVQSAMLKRSDSVSKRWSAQVPGGLSRGNSVASNRGSRDLGQTAGGDTPLANPNVGSSDTEQPTPIRDKDGFIKPALPDTPSDAARSPLPEPSTSRPASPTKDGRRWSPVKASWLENKINQSEPPKPLKSAASQQPAWMANLQKAKAARASADLGQTVASSPIPSQGFKSPDLAKSEVPRPKGRMDTISTPSKQDVADESNPKEEVLETPTEKLRSSTETIEEKSSSLPQTPSKSEASAPKGRPLPTRPKPDTPPKKDFRSALKSRSTDAEKSTSSEPEFKKAFGNLKRAETKNYKPPDTLKENILRGKTGLSVTGGPQQTKRVDEFKESLLAKKKDFAAAPTKPLARNPSQLAEKPLPEALAKRTGMLNRTKSVTSDGTSETLADTSELKPSTSAPEKGAMAPAAVVPAGLKNSALAARFNPNLAGILARGPGPAPGGSGPKQTDTQSALSSKTSVDLPESKGPELTHQTKGRARGPKRKPPRSAQMDGAADWGSQTGTQSDAVAANEPAPREGLEDKMRSYNQIKAGLVGDVGKLDALGITGGTTVKTEASAKPSAASSSPMNKAEQPLAVERSKPPAPRSPSTRIVSGSFAPASKPKEKPVGQVKAEPLATIADTSRKMNTSERPRSPAKAEDVASENSPTRTKTPAKAKSPPPVANKQVSNLVGTPSIQASPGASPTASLRAAKSPPVPAKSDTTRSLSTNIRSNTPRSDVPAKHTLEEFFGPLPQPSKRLPEIDAGAIMKSPGRATAKIETIRKQIWEISPDGKRLPMTMQGDHILFEDSMYLCTHRFVSEAGKHTTEAYLWVGDGVSTSIAEDTQLFARNAAKEAGATGRLIVLHQGKESSNFFEALGGIVIVRRGSSKDASATYMLCGRKHLGQIAFDEVELGAQSLCSGFPFIVATKGGNLFLWKGKGARADELGCARLIAMDLCVTGDVEEVDEDREPSPFWNALGSQDRSKLGRAPQWHHKASKEAYVTRLFAIDDARPKSAGLAAIQGIQAVWNRRPSSQTPDEPGTSDIREIAPYSQSDLSQDGIYVLDAYFEVYVILGWRSSARLPAFKSAMVFAQEYAILAASLEDRPCVPAMYIIFAGASAPYLRSSFRKWDDRLVTTQPVGSDGGTQMVPLHAAIDAMKG